MSSSPTTAASPYTQPTKIQGVSVLGSTGSIGTQGLAVIRANPQHYRVHSLSATGRNFEQLAQQIIEFRPMVVAVAEPEHEGNLRAALSRYAAQAQVPVPQPELLTGPEAASQVAASGAEIVLNGITGSIGLGPTLSALESGAQLALANKESLVAGADLVRRAQRYPGQIVPVDSEHSAIAQSLAAGAASEVAALILIASGGPFRGWTTEQLATVSVKQALAHPTWAMGPVISINSATMMNKGLELIEAHVLFEQPVEKIRIVVHPQSVVHSMVEFCDGSTILQASPPDMRLAIALGLSWPGRLDAVVPAIDWRDAHTWTFEPLDEDTFTAVALCRAAVAEGQLAPAVVNAANEEAVAAFLAGQISFTSIVQVSQHTLDEFLSAGLNHQPRDLADVREAEDWARACGIGHCRKMAS